MDGSKERAPSEQPNAEQPKSSAGEGLQLCKTAARSLAETDAVLHKLDR